MISCGINYFQDFIQPNLKFKIPNSDELSILKDVVNEISILDDDSSADEFQSAIFGVGKKSLYKENIDNRNSGGGKGSGRDGNRPPPPLGTPSRKP